MVLQPGDLEGKNNKLVEERFKEYEKLIDKRLQEWDGENTVQISFDKEIPKLIQKKIKEEYKGWSVTFSQDYDQREAYSYYYMTFKAKKPQSTETPWDRDR